MNNPTTLRWLYAVPERKKWYILFLTLIQMAEGGTGVLFAFLLRSIVDSAGSGDRETFCRGVLLIILLTAVNIGLQALVRWLNELSRASLENVLKKRQTDCLLRKEYATVNTIHSGEWMNRITNDTVVVAAGYVEILPGIAGTVVRMLSALIALCLIDSLFALMLIPGGLLLIGITTLFRKRLKTLHKRIQEKDGKLRVFLQERISSLMMIKSFTAEEQTSREADQYMSAHKDARMKRIRFSNLCNSGLAAMLEGLYLFGIIYCAWGILNGSMSYGMLAAVMQLLNQIQGPLVSITSYLPRYYAMQASAERLIEAETFPDDWNGNTLSAPEIKDFYGKDLAAFGLRQAGYTYYPAASENSTLSKKNMPVILKDLSFEIRKGEYVAFTGHSGCGKSTVLKLLMSIYSLDSGSKVILEENGTVIPLTAEYRRLFAYVPQGNQLMTGTIREIVSFSETGKEPDDVLIEQALWIACADEFIDKLEKGINTRLGERGTGLSEGQMQRIAIARALYSEAPVLLLDEATSALDTSTEQKLLFNLKNMTDKTVIIVTHRPAALEICDRVFEFSEEGVKESERSKTVYPD